MIFSEDRPNPVIRPNPMPDLQDMDDLISQSEVLEFFGITRSTLDNWRYGRYGDKQPRFPYLRIGGKLFYSKTQIIWWMNRMQKEVVDAYRAARLKRIKEGTKVGRPYTKG